MILKHQPARVVAFYIGAHHPHWLAISEQPLFVSHMRMRTRRTLPVARASWALDSGGYSELSDHGVFRDSPAEYARAVQRYDREIGRMCWASIQDWMVEPHVLRKTGLSLDEHQRRTVQSYLELTSLAPEIRWLPVVQGRSPLHYLAHVEMYRQAGVDLTEAPLVGVGSVCRRQSGYGAVLVLEALRKAGLTRLHGFGLKITGLRWGRHLLASADSMAWSFQARKRRDGNQNSLDYALQWNDKHIEPMLRRDRRWNEGLSDAA